MPNHVSSTCKVTGPAADVEAFRGAHFTHHDGELNFDFETVIPMPPCLHGTVSGSSADRDLERLGLKQGFMDRSKRTLSAETAKALIEAKGPLSPEGTKAIQALVETGYPSWYEWSIETWGTKWNAYQTVIGDEPNTEGFAFDFQTAWSFPEPIFAALVHRWPTLTFDLACFDEGWNFAGEGVLGAALLAPNRLPGAQPEPFATRSPVDPENAGDRDLYERVYGSPYEEED